MFNFLKKKGSAEAETRPAFEYDEDRILYFNDFGSGLNGFVPRGPCAVNEPERVAADGYGLTLELTGEEKQSGTKSLKISGRKYGWNGATLDVTKYLKEHILFYETAVWVKLPLGSPSCHVCISFETNKFFSGVKFQNFNYWHDFEPEQGMLAKFRLPVGSGDPNEWDTMYPAGYSTEDGWVLLRGLAKLRKSNFSSIFIYVETSDENSSVPLYLDNFMLLKAKNQDSNQRVFEYPWTNTNEENARIHENDLPLVR